MTLRMLPSLDLVVKGQSIDHVREVRSTRSLLEFFGLAFAWTWT